MPTDMDSTNTPNGPTDEHRIMPIDWLPLPQEVRDIICRYLFIPIHQRVPIEPLVLHHDTLKLPKSLGLMVTCKQMHDDVKEELRLDLRLLRPTLFYEFPNVRPRWIHEDPINIAIYIRTVVDYINWHLRYDSQYPDDDDLGNSAPVALDPQRLPVHPRWNYLDMTLRVSDPPAFVRFLEQFIDGLRRNKQIITIEMKAAKRPQEEVRFVKELLSGRLASNVAITVRVSEGLMGGKCLSCGWTTVHPGKCPKCIWEEAHENRFWAANPDGVCVELVMVPAQGDVLRIPWP